MEKRPFLQVKIEAYFRYLVWNYWQPIVGNIRVAEFPKSGGTWLCQMLSEMYHLEFPRNKFLPLHKCIQHAHYGGPTNYKTILLIRDGRDVMTSAYFHFLIYNKTKPRGLVERWRKTMGNCDFYDVCATMPKFIEKFTNNFRVGGKRIGWSDHVMSYDLTSPKVLVVKYEDLLKCSELELQKIANWYDLDHNNNYANIVKKYSFEVVSKRKPGVEKQDSFLRKGIINDWKNYFNAEAEETFMKYHKNALLAHGYD